MANYDFDLVTIGAGSGGVRASRIAASHGARVAIVEERYLGGTCVNVGCIPKKLFVYAAHFSDDFADAAGFGWSVGAPAFDWRRLVTQKDDEIRRLNGVYGKLLGKAGVGLLTGRASLVDAHTITIGEKKYTSEYILLATGSWPTTPTLPGAELSITSNEAFFLPELPERIVIVGGGYIGVEFAGIFHGLGLRVTQLYRGPLFLRGFDQDLREHLAAEMRKRGIDLRFNADVERIEKAARGLSVGLSNGKSLATDLVMFATGREPNTRGLGLEALGMKRKPNGAVVVDDYFRTSIPNIFAVGDCTDRMQLTPVAIAEGQAVAEALFAGRRAKVNYDNVPTAIFGIPNAATVGLTEEEARGRGLKIDVYKTTFRPLKHTLSGRDEKTLVKLVVDAESDRVLGCHMVGDEAGEIIQGLAVALNCGATKKQFDATLGIHPTAAEEFVTLRAKSPSP